MPSSSKPSSPGSPGEQAGLLAPADLHRRLVWLTLFRTVAVSLLLTATAVRLIRRREDLSSEDSLSFALIALVYVVTLVHGELLRRKIATNATAYGQVLGDVVLATCLVYLTGGVESPFTFTYSIAVIAASILLFGRGALFAGAASAASFLLLVVAVELSWLRPPEGSGPLPPGRVLFSVLSNVIAQVLIAALATYLARQLSQAGGRLSEREADLAELARLQRQILSAMPSGLITCARDGRVTFVNRAGAQILGVGEGQAFGSADELIPGVLAFGPSVRRAEVPVTTRAGPRMLGLTVSTLQDQEGGFLVVFQDLTELRRMEEELRRADHLAALGRLSAQLAHEIRNPLAAMRGSAQMLAEGAGKDTHAGRLSNILVREADRLSSLVEDFLRFARPPPPDRRQTDLRQLVTETLEMLRSDPLSRGVTLESALAEVSAPVDPSQLRQVLLNLLRNALDAARPEGQVKVSLRKDESAVKLEVWDSAGSISAQNLPRLFEPFFTTKEGGTGLGLSTAHSIVSAHGGSLRVTSSPEGGTSFVVQLHGGGGTLAEKR